MRIKNISNKRGIYLIYDGNKYVVLSEYYGVVAESTRIERDVEKDTVTIDFNICEWYGYWALQPIITRGVKAEETCYVDKTVIINYTTIKNNGEMHLNKYITMDVKEY